MPARQTVPRLYLMTDERMGDGLWRALERLPRGAGVIFRHHATAADERRRIYELVRTIARRRRLVLLLAGPSRRAIGWRADGMHGRGRVSGSRIRTAPAHDAREVIAAIRSRADAVFISPIFATRSHPDARVLGRARFGELARLARKRDRAVQVIALGGVDNDRFRPLRALGADGWAAIDGWCR